LSQISAEVYKRKFKVVEVVTISNHHELQTFGKRAPKSTKNNTGTRRE